MKKGVSVYKLFQMTYRDYIDKYQDRLNSFLKDYEDNTEIYFIEKEIKLLEDGLKSFKQIVIDLKDEDENKEEILDLFENRINTNSRIKDFLNDRRSNQSKEITINSSDLWWSGTHIEFTELIKAIYEAKLIGSVKKPQLTQKEFFNIMRDVFNIEYFNESDKISDLIKRKEKTILLNKLELSLAQFIDKKVNK